MIAWDMMEAGAEGIGTSSNGVGILEDARALENVFE